MRSLSTCLFVSLALAIVALSSCQNNPNVRDRKDELHIALATEPPQLDPRKLRDATSAAIVRMFSEGLLRYNKDGELCCGLAEKYEIDESHTRYLFTLREDLHWSDGSPLTAHDFEYSWKKILEPHFISEDSYLLFPIKNAQAAKEGKLPGSQIAIAALDDLHLEVILHQPLVYFPQLLVHYTFHPVPRGIDNRQPHWAKQVNSHFLSCGAFELVSWQHNSELKLIKNKNYWDAEQVRLQSIHVAIVHDESTTLNLFEAGELDFIGHPFGALPIDAIPQWRAKGLLNSRPVAASLWYKINTTLPLLRNQKVRQALSLSIDRKNIADNITHGTLLPATHFLPPSMQLNDPLISETAMREKAQRLLIEGMHEEGIDWVELPTLHVSFNDSEISRRIAQAVQQQWKDNLGLEVTLESLEWKVYLNKIHKMDYEIARMGWAVAFHDPMTYLEPYKYNDLLRGANNETGWEDPRYTQLLDEAIASSNPKEYNERLAEAEKLLVEACPTIPLLHYTTNWLQSSNLKQVSINPLGQVDFKWAYLEAETTAPRK